MKLSEILGWLGKITSHLHPVFFEKGREHLNTDALQRAFGEGANYMKDACDREIDREALAWALTKLIYHGNTEKKIDEFISTMPTWLKRSEK